MKTIGILVPIFIVFLIGASVAFPHGEAIEGIQTEVEQPNQVETELNEAIEVAPVQQAEAAQQQVLQKGQVKSAREAPQETLAEADSDSPAISELFKYAQAEAADDVQSAPTQKEENIAIQELQARPSNQEGASAAAQAVKTSVFQLKQVHPSQLSSVEAVQLYLADAIKLADAEAAKAECDEESGAECLKKEEEKFKREAVVETAELIPSDDSKYDAFVRVKMTGAPKVVERAVQIDEEAEALHATQAEAERAEPKPSFRYEDEVAKCAVNCYPCPNDWKNCCCQKNRHYTPLNFD